MTTSQGSDATSSLNVLAKIKSPFASSINVNTVRPTRISAKPSLSMFAIHSPEAFPPQRRSRSLRAGTRSGNRDAAEDVYRQALELAEETRLREKLGTQVKIRTRKEGGSIEVAFYSGEDLERLVDIFEQIKF